MSFQISSKDLKDGGRLPEAQVLNGMGYSGGNRSPHLAWEGAPEGTKSFVVTLYDPDAPTGSGWWHWVVINIPATVKELPAGCGSEANLPAGALQTRTDFGAAGYGGAAPPPGPAHHYIFTVHALKVPRLDLDAQASAAMVGFMVHMNSLAKATLTLTYGK
jgi:Raf kinase inhibitor-like YbhB/YbcL family protein